MDRLAEGELLKKESGFFKNSAVYLFNISAFKTCFVNPLDSTTTAVSLVFDGYICRRGAACNTVSFAIFRIVNFNFKVCDSFFKYVNSFWQIFNGFPLIPSIKQTQQGGNIHERAKVEILQRNASNFTNKGREITLPYFNKIGRRNEHISFIIRRCAWLARSGNCNFIAARQFVLGALRRRLNRFLSSDIQMSPVKIGVYRSKARRVFLAPSCRQVSKFSTIGRFYNSTIDGILWIGNILKNQDYFK